MLDEGLTDLQVKLHFNQHKKKFFKDTTCFLGMNNECDGKSIRSHSISKSALRLLSKNGHVGNIQVNLNMFSDDPEPGYERTGIRSASTFPGFCSKHDNEIFKDLDEFSGPISQRIAELSFYRVLVQEVSKKSSGLALFESYRTQGEGEKFRQYMAAGTEKGLEDLDFEIRNYDTYGRRTRSKLCFIEIQFNSVLPYGFSSPKNLNIIIESKVDLSSPQSLVSFSLLPHAEGSRFLFVYPKSESKNAMKMLRAMDLDKRNSANDLLYFGLTQFENMYFDPDWFESLPVRQKKGLEDLFYRTTDGDETLVRLPFSFFDIGIKAIRASCQSGRLWKRRFR